MSGNKGCLVFIILIAAGLFCVASCRRDQKHDVNNTSAAVNTVEKTEKSVIPFFNKEKESSEENKEEVVEPTVEPVKETVVVYKHEWGLFPLFPFFVVFGFYWWLLTAAFVALLVGELLKDEDAVLWPFVTIGGYIALTFIFGTFDLATLAVGWQKILIVIAGYFTCGIVYMYVRWTLFVNTLKRKINNLVIKFSDDSRIKLVGGQIPPANRESFVNWVVQYKLLEFPKSKKYPYYGRTLTANNILEITYAQTYLRKLTAWAMLWWLSLPIWLLKDYVRELWMFIIERLSKSLNAISSRVMGNTADNFQIVEENKNE